ncbi:MAG: hypothetical protein JSU88_01840 [Nitrospinaceae bacterium]|jgi:hypothetical protein|nr:MAG: hypothetical protein JSU88_01840 [Nitrospinaceae bacterium]
MNFIHFMELLLVAAILVGVGLPLFRGLSKTRLFKPVNPRSEEYKHLLVRKEEVLLSIKELEFDFKTDKVSEEDYHGVRHKLELEAAAILDRLDQLEQEKKNGSARAAKAI